MDTTHEHTGQLEAEICELKAQLAQQREIARQNEYIIASEKERLQALGDNFPTGTMFRFRMDAVTGDMSLDYVSATWEKILGVTAEATMTDIHAIFACVDSRDLSRLMDAIDESAHTMCNVDIELRYRHPGDSHRWLHLTSHPHREGDTIFSDGLVLDITQRKRAEQALIFEKERLQSLGDHFPNGTLFRFQLEAAVLSLPDAPTTWLGHLQLSYASATWEKISNVPLIDAMKNAALPFMKIYSDDLAAIVPVMYDCLQNLSTFNIEVRYVYAEDAEMRWLQVSAHPRIEDDLVVCDGFILDITNRKQTESELALYREELERLVKKRTEELEATNEELAATNEELQSTNAELFRYRTQLEQMVERKTRELTIAKEKAEESDRLKSAFLANMSHEIRTPLNGIVGFLNFLGNDDLSLQRRGEYINIINNSAGQLVKLIGDIVDVAKIEAGQMDLCPMAFRINDLLVEIQAFFEAWLRTNDKTNITMILDQSGFIDHCMCFIDSMRLRQILINLIGNAVKFTDKGYIRFGYRNPVPDMLEFVVEDTGMGVPENQRALIFERFHQAEQGNNHRYGGTGLGLTISRNLVKMMGGDMRVESTPGTGSSFYFTVSFLPVQPDDQHIFDPLPTPTISDNSPLAGKIVLLAEPVEIKRRYYEKLLFAAGVTVISTSSAQQFPDIANQDKEIDAIIVPASVYDAFINETLSQPVVCIISGQPDEGSDRYDAVLVEPVDYTTLTEVLQKVMN